MASPTRTDWTGTKVLVTGACGFLGSAITRTLAALGAHVHAAIHSEPWRLEGTPRLSRVESLDVSDQAAVTALYSSFRPEVTFHAAAYGVSHASQDLVEAARVNILGGVHLAMAAQALPQHRFVNLGTRYEAGRDRVAIREEDPFSPVGIYGTTKASAQVILEDLSRRSGLIFRTGTLFGVYGPFDSPSKFIPYVIESLLDGNPPRLSPCGQVRDFTFLDDAVEGLLRLAAIGAPGVLRANIGTGSPVTLRQVAETVADLTGRPASITFGAQPYRKDEVWHLIPDLSHSRTLLDWSPRFTLAEGLRRTIDWYQTRRAGIPAALGRR